MVGMIEVGNHNLVRGTLHTLHESDASEPKEPDLINPMGEWFTASLAYNYMHNIVTIWKYKLTRQVRLKCIPWAIYRLKEQKRAYKKHAIASFVIFKYCAGDPASLDLDLQ